MIWLDSPLVGFDTETTGVRTATDRIVSAAIVTRTGSNTEAQNWLINPGIEIPAGATQVHGITNEMVQRGGLPPEQACEEIAVILADALEAGQPIVAFNASFDLSILESELERHGLASLASRVGDAGPASLRPVVDPLVLDRHLDRYRKGSRKLVDMCRHYNVTVESDNLHAADVDVIATLDLLHAMAAVYPDIGETKLNDLHEVQVSSHRVWAENFRAWLASKGRTEDLPSLDWPLSAGE
jgi:DNA polymerase-3 subunit epsilon